MCFELLCGKESLARASMSFKTKTRASGSSIVAVGGSVKLDAERLARASMSFKTKTRASGSSFVTVGGSVKLDAVVVEDTGSKGRFTNSAAERSALGSSEDPFSFKTGLGEIRA
ncbi:hypothetical protein MRB53_010197 [Persea americana]|uniref:Uncharacterized protein n=1 Tax=Persea americana TaxID=3435 RepID=A0ACC2LRJ1_PERAE|nr:hypothetical protein MRB53_010197 [Persea americana]